MIRKEGLVGGRPSQVGVMIASGKGTPLSSLAAMNYYEGLVEAAADS